jgi:hypothetical protein
MLLERLIPVAQSFTVHLMGSGLPSFWIAQLPDMQLTLGLSGWTSNDWSRAGQFDLLAPRGEVDDDSKARVFAALGKRWYATSEQLAQDTGLARLLVERALALYTQAGRVVYDLTEGVYRLRELTREPLPMDVLRFSSEVEQQAAVLLAARALSRTASERDDAGGTTLRGKVKDGARTFEPWLRLDLDERIVDGQCQCNHFTQNRLRRGPCAHLLALRLARAQTTPA